MWNGGRNISQEDQEGSRNGKEGNKVKTEESAYSPRE